MNMKDSPNHKSCIAFFMMLLPKEDTLALYDAYGARVSFLKDKNTLLFGNTAYARFFGARVESFDGAGPRALGDILPAPAPNITESDERKKIASSPLPLATCFQLPISRQDAEMLKEKHGGMVLEQPTSTVFLLDADAYEQHEAKMILEMTGIFREDVAAGEKADIEALAEKMAQRLGLDLALVTGGAT